MEGSPVYPRPARDRAVFARRTPVAAMLEFSVNDGVEDAVCPHAPLTGCDMRRPRHGLGRWRRALEDYPEVLLLSVWIYCNLPIHADVFIEWSQVVKTVALLFGRTSTFIAVMGQNSDRPLGDRPAPERRPHARPDDPSPSHHQHNSTTSKSNLQLPSPSVPLAQSNTSHPTAQPFPVITQPSPPKMSDPSKSRFNTEALTWDSRPAVRLATTLANQS